MNTHSQILASTGAEGAPLHSPSQAASDLQASADARLFLEHSTEVSDSPFPLFLIPIAAVTHCGPSDPCSSQPIRASTRANSAVTLGPSLFCLSSINTPVHPRLPKTFCHFGTLVDLRCPPPQPASTYLSSSSAYSVLKTRILDDLPLAFLRHRSPSHSPRRSSGWICFEVYIFVHSHSLPWMK